MGCKGRDELRLKDCAGEVENSPGATTPAALEKRVCRYIHFGIWGISFTVCMFSNSSH